MPSSTARWCSVFSAVLLAACGGDGGGGAAAGVGASGANGAGTGGGTDADASAAADTDAGVGGGNEPCVCDGSVTPSVACEPECKVAFEVLFSDQQLPSFYLTIFDDNGTDGGIGGSSWENIFTNCTQNDTKDGMFHMECEHQLATFHAEYDPTPDDNDPTTVVTPEIEVGVHRKGRYSWDPSNQKPPLKIKFTEFGGERFLGLTRLTLNNAIQDPSMLRERMSYSVYRAAGVVAPMANNAKLYIRKNAAADYEYYGVYVNVQTLDRRFVESHFDEVGGEVGNLYDTYNTHYYTDLDRADCRKQAGTAAGAQEALFELETNDALNDRSDLTALIDSVFKPGCSNSAFCTGSNCCCRPTNWDQSNFVETVSAHLDLTALLRLMAAQALNTDWDGFAGTRNNYKLYHDLVSDKFYVFPWGTDQTLDYQDKSYYPNWNYALNHTNSNRDRALFMTRCEDDPDDCYAKYLEQVAQVQAIYAGLPLRDWVDAWEAQIEDAVLADTHKNGFYDDAQFSHNVDAVRQYVETRAACVSNLLNGMACTSLTCPAGMTDCKTGGN